MDEIRIPQQKRSIEKKEKIIKAGLQLFCEKGYFNTNTAEIAKYAGVSTGIVYNYFKDKKDIFISSIEMFYKESMNPLYEKLNYINVSATKEFIGLYFKDAILEHQKINKKIYKEMEALQHLDEEIDKFFHSFTNEAIDRISSILIDKGFPSKNIHEKLHIIFNMLESTLHEICYYNETNGTNSEVIINYTSEIITNLILKP